MPTGIFHTLTGTISWSGHCYVLVAEDGERWCVEMIGGPEALVGRRVTVRGVRLGFHWLFVWRAVAMDG